MDFQSALSIAIRGVKRQRSRIGTTHADDDVVDELIYEPSVCMFEPGMIVVAYTASGRDGLCCVVVAEGRQGMLRANKAHGKPIGSIASTEHLLRKLCKEPVVIAIIRAVCAHSLYSEMIPNASCAPSTRWNAQAASLPLKSSPDYWVAEGQTQEG
jgi:hypothetical protein